jgi:5,10-methylenetetrahydromethanopterin reductase
MAPLAKGSGLGSDSRHRGWEIGRHRDRPMGSSTGWRDAEGMRIGVFIGEVSGERTTAEQLVANARAAEAAGFASGWVPHIPWSLDGLTAIALAAAATSSIELGTAVVPTYPRHPLSMAQDALSVQAVAKGRFTLGIGPSHPAVIERMYGLAYTRPAAHTAEYVQALRACFASAEGQGEGQGQGEGHNMVSWDGEFYRFRSMLEVPGGSPVTILVAALAPLMLELTGRHADGTVTFWADERAVGEHIVPALTSAAARAGRPAPRVVVGLPVAVVADVEAARRRAARMFTSYESIPTYQRILSRGAGEHPVDAAIIGDEKTVADRIRRMADLGATDFMAAVLGLDDDREAARRRTMELLASL